MADSAPFVGLVLTTYILLSMVASKRLKKADKPIGFFVLVWVLPVVGALAIIVFEKSIITQEENDFNSRLIDINIPDKIELSNGDIVDVPKVKGKENHLTLDLDALLNSLDGCTDESLHDELKYKIRRIWLQSVTQWLGKTWNLYEDDYSVILSAHNSEEVVPISKSVRFYQSIIKKTLLNLAEFCPIDKSVIFIFDNEDIYYSYVAQFYKEDGEYAPSGGVFINIPFPHLIVKSPSLMDSEPTLIHEMTHSSLHKYHLPVWIDEGLAQNMEIQCGFQNAVRENNLAQKHLGYWSKEKGKRFWSGESFSTSGTESELAYDLARILVQLIVKDWDNFVDFVHNLSYEDSGLTAAKNYLNIDLEEFVEHL
ncbi:hypothetical protein [Pleionea sediminis]|uniref:hypothetical protein n=1 Tax=Pleionea sediminis TaxID=2569479 RepID=UPI00118601D3|nr:hypothetical protein [Pleionea sediminis]